MQKGKKNGPSVEIVVEKQGPEFQSLEQNLAVGTHL